MLVKTTDGTPDAVKVARPVWSGGKSGDNFKGLPITIAEKLKTALTEASEDFLIRGNTEYPDCADSSAWLIGKARYKDKDEEKASAYEAELYGKGKKIDFRDVSISAINEIKAVISQMEEVLRKRE